MQGFGNVGSVSADLMAEVFPGVPLRSAIAGRQTLLSIDRAQQLLGYLPEHGWQDELAGRTKPTVA